MKNQKLSFMNLSDSQTDALDIEDYTMSLPHLMGAPEKPLKWFLENDVIYEMPCSFDYLINLNK